MQIVFDTEDRILIPFIEEKTGLIFHEILNEKIVNKTTFAKENEMVLYMGENNNLFVMDKIQFYKEFTSLANGNGSKYDFIEGGK